MMTEASLACSWCPDCQQCDFAGASVVCIMARVTDNGDALERARLKGSSPDPAKGAQR